MSCTAADLINIQPLTLSDTFHTWFDRTNEVIDVLSGVNILNIEVGPTSGLVLETGCSGGYYNGVVTLDTNVGGGIGNGVVGYRPNHIVIDFSDLIDATGRLVSSRQFTAGPRSGVATFGCSELAKGVYQLVVRGKTQVWIERLVK
jgi:hypothetical protein